jgi:hypothetical protein
MHSEVNLSSSTAGRRRRWNAQRVALALAVTLVCSLATNIGVGCLSAALASASPAPCDTSEPAVVNYVVGPGPSGTIVVRSVRVSGLPASCDGDPVVLDLYGNSAGDPAVSLSDDELLARADSTLDPCTQQPLASSGLVTDGALTLSLCTGGGRGGVVSVHDLTAVGLSVAGEQVATAGSTSSGSDSLQPATPAIGGTRSRSLLAFTGADIGSAVLAGLIALAIGAMLVRMSRRRERNAMAACASPDRR